MACNPNCVIDIATLTLDSCQIVLRKGSIRNFAFQDCKSPFTDVSGEGIEDIAAWEAALAADPPTIFVSGELLASKPKGSVQKFRASGCRPEIVQSQTQTINFKDYNSDTTGLSEFAFWNSIFTNYAGLNLMVITCDELVYFYESGDWSIEVDNVIAENLDEANYMEGIITISQTGMVVPVSVPGITDIL